MSNNESKWIDADDSSVKLIEFNAGFSAFSNNEVSEYLHLKWLIITQTL